MYRRDGCVDAVHVNFDVEAQAAMCTKVHGMARGLNNTQQAWIWQMGDVHGDVLVLQQHLSDHREVGVEVGHMRPGHSKQQRSNQ